MAAVAGALGIIPGTVTMSGEAMVDFLVRLIGIEEWAMSASLGAGSKVTDLLNDVIAELHTAALGPMYRECDLGTEPRNCNCEACSGDDYASGTPIYRLIQERAAHIQRQAAQEAAA
jgi:hypothetical protein